MTYSEEISRQHPSCFIFLVDQSGSMVDPLAGASGESKADGVAKVMNRLLFELTLRCIKVQTDGPYDYFDVGIIGYGNGVGSILGGALQGRDIVPISELANNPLRIDQSTQKIPDGNGGIVEVQVQQPVWVEPKSDNGTPMREALDQAHKVLQPWVAAHPTSYPPVVMNITDGEANDDPRVAANAIKALKTNDGNVLLLNIHLSSENSQKLCYPDEHVALPDDFARMLFEMSSVLPSQIISEAPASMGLSSTARGFIFQSGYEEFIGFLDIGTRKQKGLR